MTFKHCHQCDYNRPEAEVVAGVCIVCRADRDEDERPVSTLLSALMFRQAKPNSKKSVTERPEGTRLTAWN